MTLPSSGAISLSQVNTELNQSSTGQISLGDANVRALAGVPSGAISMANLHGKSSTLVYNITTPQSNCNLRTLIDSMGYAGQVTNVVVNISATISGSTTSADALTIGSWPAGVDLDININSGGLILGQYGGGGAGATSGSAAGVGGVGGDAIYCNAAISGGSITISITGTGAVKAGGGGGGGGGRGSHFVVQDGTYYYNGGAGGHGAGTSGTQTAGVNPSDAYAGTGGTGGTYGATGSAGGNGAGSPSNYVGGSGGAGGAALRGSGNCSRVGWTASTTYWGSIVA